MIFIKNTMNFWHQLLKVSTNFYLFNLSESQPRGRVIDIIDLRLEILEIRKKLDSMKEKIL